jgi:hypothetical protein
MSRDVMTVGEKERETREEKQETRQQNATDILSFGRSHLSSLPLLLLLSTLGEAELQNEFYVQQGCNVLRLARDDADERDGGAGPVGVFVC